MLYVIVILKDGVEYLFTTFENDLVQGVNHSGESNLCRIANNINNNYVEKAMVRETSKLSSQPRLGTINLLAMQKRV